MKLQTFSKKQKNLLNVLRFISKYKVSGHSMEPLIIDTANVLISRIPYWFNDPKINDIVVFRNSGKIFLKRIIKINNGKYFVAGDNKNDSYDSRNFGDISRKQILGKVLYILK